MKEQIAAFAAKQVTPGMLVGLGTGSTANFLIRELARRVQSEGLSVTVVASSLTSALLAKELGLTLQSIEQTTHLDLYLDGADEVDPDGVLLKGRGYDLVKERLLARISERFLVMVEPSKMVRFIGERFPIPVEVMPMAWQMVERALRGMGGNAQLRQNAAKDAPAITSMGNLVLDARFSNKKPAELAPLLNDTPGIVAHGIFLNHRHTIISNPS
jgi:ribose 5-phosphate isomerase A